MNDSEKMKELGLSTQFKPGQSGNPKGKPKGSKSFKTILGELLDKKVKNEGVKSATEIQEMFPDGNLTYKQAMMVRMIAIAVLNPESKSAQRIMDRLEGLPKQTIEQNIISDEQKIIISQDGEEISLKIKEVKKDDDEFPAE